MLRWLRLYVDDGFTTNLVRYPASSLLYLPLVVAVVRRRGLTRFWLMALIPTSINILGQTLWAWAPIYLDANTMSFIGRTSIVWAILGAFVLFPDERRLAQSGFFWGGAVCAFSGFVIMSWSGMETAGDNTLFGIAMMLLCAMCWGFYGVTVRLVIKDQHPLFVFGVIGGYTSLGIIALAPLGEPAVLLNLPPLPWAILLLSSLLGIAVAHGLYYAAIQRIGVAISTLTLLLAPFVTILFAAIFLDERFSPGQWIGGIILLAGASMAIWSQKRLQTPLPADPHEMGQE